MEHDLIQFDIDCTACPRLSRFLSDVRKKYPSYHARPVPAFGVNNPKLLIVGLAPGLHGANASGRPFTGDHAGILLYETLYKFGFSNKSVSQHSSDGLQLKNCRITNAVKCLPPENKPIGLEINTCNSFLAGELKNVDKNAVVLCLGQISHKAVMKVFTLKQSDYPFQHAKLFTLGNGLKIMDSYHCSRYNTQTKRLTKPMFQNIFKRIQSELNL